MGLGAAAADAVDAGQSEPERAAFPVASLPRSRRVQQQQSDESGGGLSFVFSTDQGAVPGSAKVVAISHRTKWLL